MTKSIFQAVLSKVFLQFLVFFSCVCGACRSMSMGILLGAERISFLLFSLEYCRCENNIFANDTYTDSAVRNAPYPCNRINFYNFEYGQGKKKLKTQTQNSYRMAIKLVLSNLFGINDSSHPPMHPVISYFNSLFLSPRPFFCCFAFHLEFSVIFSISVLMLLLHACRVYVQQH